MNLTNLSNKACILVVLIFRRTVFRVKNYSAQLTENERRTAEQKVLIIDGDCCPKLFDYSKRSSGLSGALANKTRCVGSRRVFECLRNSRGYG